MAADLEVNSCTRWGLGKFATRLHWSRTACQAMLELVSHSSQRFAKMYVQVRRLVLQLSHPHLFSNGRKPWALVPICVLLYTLIRIWILLLIMVERASNASRWIFCYCTSTRLGTECAKFQVIEITWSWKCHYKMCMRELPYWRLLYFNLSRFLIRVPTFVNSWLQCNGLLV